MITSVLNIFSELLLTVTEGCRMLIFFILENQCFTLRQCGEKKVVGTACWGYSPRLKMSVRDGAATMVVNVAGGGGGGRPASPNNQDGRPYLLQIYPRLVAQPTSCCNLRWVCHSVAPWEVAQQQRRFKFCILIRWGNYCATAVKCSVLTKLLLTRVHKDATAASVILDVAAVLGLDPGRMYVLAEVKESGGEEWVLEPGDLPAQRFLLWPRKAQEQHPKSLGFYFLLQASC